MGRPEDEMFTVEEVAEWLKVKPRALRNWRDTGTGPKSVRIGKHIRYRRCDVEEWINANVEQRA